MSSLFSAIGRGLSAAGYAAGDIYGKQALMEAQGEAEMQRAMRLAEFKQQLEDKSRQQQGERIRSEAGKIADEKVGEKRGLVEAGITDRSAWTPEHQAAVDQSLAAERGELANDPDVVLQAAGRTGDLSVKDQAIMAREDKRLTAAEEAAARREAWLREREDRRDARFEEQQNRMDARQSRTLAAQFEALDKRLAKQGEGGRGDTVQSTHTDGNGYLIAVLRNGTTRRMTDPDGKPITSQAFEQRVDRMVTALRRDGDAKVRKMGEEELRAHVRRTLMNSDGAGGEPPPAAPPGPAPKPSGPASATRPPLSSFMR